MPGIRVGTTSAIRNQSIAVECPRKYKAPYACPQCQVVHLNKTVHLKLDAEGTTIVSREVFEDLRRAGLPELEFLNIVEKPPAQTISISDAGVKGAYVAKTVKTQGGRLAVLSRRLFKVDPTHVDPFRAQPEKQE